MRPMLLLSVLIAAAALLAVPAAAKEEGVRARLDEPVRLGTAPGETIKVAWHLVDQEGRPFGVKVPRGGIRKLVVGLRGWRIIGERKERADAFFQFDPPLARRCS